MRINVSIDGVLRNFLQKFEYHYQDYYLNNESENETFEYGIEYPVKGIDNFKFQSKDELDVFMYLEFPLEIFGHAGLTSSNAVSDLNKIIFENKGNTYTMVGLDEYGKSKPSSLFFLSKNGFLGNNVKFITTENIKKEWKNCDMWITDNKNIIDSCPKNKKCVKFNTQYNDYFTHKYEINNIKELEELCKKFSEKSITSISMELLKNVQSKVRKLMMKTEKQKTTPQPLK